MGEFNSLQLEHQNCISTITLNRPDKHNAIDSELISELTQAMRDCQSAVSHCIVLKANGKNFCAGADLNWMRASREYSAERNKEDSRHLAQLLQSISDSPKPVISVIQGRAMGGACGFIAASDIAIAEENASFCFSEVKLGLIPATISPHVLRRIGYQDARHLFLTADLIQASEAHAIKLIDHVVKNQDEANVLAQDIADKLRQNGPNALSQVKVLLNHLHPINDEVIDFTATMLANIRVSLEAQEGMNAFFEKRQPNWYQHDH